MHGFKKENKLRMSSWPSALNECFVAVIYYGEKNNTIADVCVCDAHINWYSDWKTVCHGNCLELFNQSDRRSALTFPLTSGFFICSFFCSQCLSVNPRYSSDSGTDEKLVWLDYIHSLCCCVFSDTTKTFIWFSLSFPLGHFLGYFCP